MRLQDFLKCNISRKKKGSSWFFPTRWYFFVWWTLPGMLKVLKTTSLQCLSSVSSKRWVIYLIFCMKINIKVFIQSWYHDHSLACPKYPKWQACKYHCNVSKKEGMKFILRCRWTSAFPTSWCFCVWWAWPGMSTVPKITNLQYLKACVHYFLFFTKW